MGYMLKYLLMLIINSYVQVGTTLEVRNISLCYGNTFNNYKDISCGDSEVILVRSVRAMTKPSSSQCPQEETHFTPAAESCCRYEDNDCGGEYTGSVFKAYFNRCHGKQSCTQLQASWEPTSEKFPHCNSSIYPERTNYMIFEYSCVPVPSTNSPCSNTAVMAESVYLWNEGYPEIMPPSDTCNCSIEALCDSQIAVTAIDLRLNNSKDGCLQHFLISDDFNNNVFVDCVNNNDFRPITVFTSASYFTIISFTNNVEIDSGQFWLEISGLESAEFSLRCGTEIHTSISSPDKEACGVISTTENPNSTSTDGSSSSDSGDNSTVGNGTTTNNENGTVADDNVDDQNNNTASGNTTSDNGNGEEGNGTLDNANSANNNTNSSIGTTDNENGEQGNSTLDNTDGANNDTNNSNGTTDNGNTGNGTNGLENGANNNGSSGSIDGNGNSTNIDGTDSGSGNNSNGTTDNSIGSGNGSNTNNTSGNGSGDGTGSTYGNDTSGDTDGSSTGDMGNSSGSVGTSNSSDSGNMQNNGTSNGDQDDDLSDSTGGDSPDIAESTSSDSNGMVPIIAAISIVVIFLLIVGLLIWKRRPIKEKLCPSQVNEKQDIDNEASYGDKTNPLFNSGAFVLITSPPAQNTTYPEKHGQKPLIEPTSVDKTFPNGHLSPIILPKVPPSHLPPLKNSKVKVDVITQKSLPRLGLMSLILNEHEVNPLPSIGQSQNGFVRHGGDGIDNTNTGEEPKQKSSKKKRKKNKLLKKLKNRNNTLLLT